MLIIPAIDLREGRCVRLRQGRRDDAKVYDGDPVEIAKAYATAGARMLHVVDLDGAFDGIDSQNRGVAARIIHEAGVPVQFGGGLRSIADVENMMNRGAARVVIGTLAVESPETLRRLVEIYGERIAVGIDARDGKALTRGWEESTDTSAVDLARRVAASGVARIVYTDIARDGMLSGPNIEGTCAIARTANIPVTASGGISSLADISALRDENEPLLDSVIIGKALYERRFTLEEALRFE